MPLSPSTRSATTVLAAALVAAGGLLTAASPAAAAAPAPVEWTFVDVLPCQSEPGLFEITLRTRDRMHERSADTRYSESSTSIGTFTAQPVTLDSGTGSTEPRAGASWSGRVVLTHTATDGTAGAGHAVSTFGLRVLGVSDTGERAGQHLLAHYTGTARPEDPEALVRRAFARSTCR